MDAEHKRNVNHKHLVIIARSDSTRIKLFTNGRKRDRQNKIKIFNDGKMGKGIDN